jgi:pectate lyase
VYDVDWTDQAIEADIRPTLFAGSDRWFGLVARRIDDRNYYYVTFRSSGDTIIRRMRDGVFTNLAIHWGEPFVAGRNYRVRSEAVGDQLAAFVNGKGLTRAKDSTFTHGRSGVASYKASFDVDNVILSGGTRIRAFVNGELKVQVTDPAVIESGRNAMIMYKAAADYTDYFAYQP